MSDIIHIDDPEMKKKRVTQFSTHEEMFAGEWEGSERFLQLKAVAESERGGAAPILGGGNGDVQLSPGSCHCNRDAAKAKSISGDTKNSR